MPDERASDQRRPAPLDPGAYIGSEPELEAETIPGGVKPGDERVAAYDSTTKQTEGPANRRQAEPGAQGIESDDEGAPRSGSAS